MSFQTKHWIQSLIGNHAGKALPVLSFPSIQLLGISVGELIISSENQARGMKAVADRTPDALASVSLMDLSVEAECFGSTVRVSDDEVPTIIGRVINSPEDADAIEIPKPGMGRTGIYIEAISKAVILITDRPVLAGIIGPFSLAGRLVDVSEALINCYEEPEMMHTVLGKATEFLIAYALKYKSTGAAGVVVAEPLTGLLSPAMGAEFSEPYMKRFVSAVQDDDFSVIYHNCGNTTIKMIDSILSVGCHAYHFGNAISMKEMMAHIPPDVVAMGNVDPAAQFRNGTPQSIREETLRIMDECREYKNFIISSGCDIPPMSKWENIDAFFAAVKEFN